MGFIWFDSIDQLRFVSFHNRSGTSNPALNRKTYDFDGHRVSQYRDRMGDVKIPSDLCNGSKWDTLTRKIWAKFDERRQPQALYEKKIRLWAHLCQQIKVNISVYVNECSVIAVIAYCSINWPYRSQSFILSDNNATIQFVFGWLDGVWLRLRFVGCWYVSCVAFEHKFGSSHWGGASLKSAESLFTGKLS